MHNITELFAALEETMRSAASPDMPKRVRTACVPFMEALIEDDVIIPDGLFDGLSQEQRRSILLGYGSSLMRGAMQNFQHHVL